MCFIDVDPAHSLLTNVITPLGATLTRVLHEFIDLLVDLDNRKSIPFWRNNFYVSTIHYHSAIRKVSKCSWS